jgi:hypothetical protein
MMQVMLWSDEEITRIRSTAMRSARKNFSFERWLSVIQEACYDLGKSKSTRDLFSATRGAESALLFLSSLFRDSLS